MPDNAFGHPGINLEKGWYCWVYPKDGREFEEWMQTYCPTSDVVHRFNSGDPMYTVHIPDDKEATMFALKWGVGK